MYNIINLILGLIVAAGIPLGMLWLAIKWANKIDKMENNRRSFFKGLAAFASGVVAAKVTSYVPRKKEELLVSSTITIHHNGEQYHPLIVKKTEDDEHVLISTNTDSGHSIGGIRFKDKTEPKIRKANI